MADNNNAKAPIVAERTMALIYSVFQRLCQQFANTRAGTWQQSIDFDRSYHFQAFDIVSLCVPLDRMTRKHIPRPLIQPDAE